MTPTVIRFKQYAHAIGQVITYSQGTRGMASVFQVYERTADGGIGGLLHSSPYSDEKAVTEFDRFVEANEQQLQG